MTGPSPDLDALREKAEAMRHTAWEPARRERGFPESIRVYQPDGGTCDILRFEAWSPDRLESLAAYVAAASPDVLLAVLDLVEEQRKALDRLLPYSDHLRTCAIAEKRPPGVCTCGYLDALAGSPAENKEPCPACKGVGSYKRIVARRAITVDCPHCNGTGKA